MLIAATWLALGQHLASCDTLCFCLSDSGPSVAEIQNSQDSCTKSSFAASCLTLPQFVQLMDNFVGEDISLRTVKRLAAFIKEEYKQTEEEKMEQLEKVNIDKVC